MTTRQDIINAAIKLFEKSGLKFSILDIAEKLNTSKRTIYQHFDSKDELVYNTIIYVFDDLERQHYEILATGMPLVDKLKEILLVYPSMIDFENVRVNTLIEQYPHLHAIIDTQLASKWELTLSVFGDCKRHGLMKNCSDIAFKTLMLGAYDGCLAFKNHKEVLAECIDAVFNGLTIKVN